MASAWLVFVPLTLYVAPRYGLVAAWSCVIVYLATMALLIWLRFRGTAWLKPALERAAKSTDDVQIRVSATRLLRKLEARRAPAARRKNSPDRWLEDLEQP